MVYKKYKLFLLLISILILLLIVWYANPIELFSVLMQSDLKLILIAFIISNVAVALRVLKWKVLLDNVGLRELFPVQMFGIAIGNFTPGKISDPLKALVLKPLKNKAVAKTLPSILWERIMDTASLVLLSFIALQIMTTKFEIFILSLVCMTAFVILIIILFTALYKKSFGMYIFRLIRKLPVLRKINERFIDTFYAGKIQKQKIIASFFITFLTWILEGVILYFTFMSLGIVMNPLLLSSIIALSVIIGVATSLPGGIGSTEAVMIVLLGILDVKGSVIISGVLISRFLSFWYYSILGGFSFLYLSRKIELKKIL